MRCSSWGFGVLGTAIAVGTYLECVDKLKKGGYRDLSEENKNEGPKVSPSSNSINAQAIAPKINVGSKWVYNTRGTRIGTTTLHLDSKGKHNKKPAHFYSSKGKMASLDKEGNKVLVPYNISFIQNKDLALIQMTTDIPAKAYSRKILYDPPYNFYKWPLKVGKSWSSVLAANLPNANETTVNFSVTNFGKVTVPAGSFDTFYLSGVVDSTGAKVVELWYSPQVKSYVKKIGYNNQGRDILELTSYFLNEKKPVSTFRKNKLNQPEKKFLEKLKDLKKLHSAGKINKEEYEQRKSKFTENLLNNITEKKIKSEGEIIKELKELKLKHKKGTINDKEYEKKKTELIKGL